jgi:DNA-binding LacI/PurR family transcriptional regulator
VKITFKEIAQRAGVSQTAVSFAIHGTGRLSPSVREHIQQVAEGLGYRPNHLVKSLRQGRTQTIGVMMVMHTQTTFAANLFRGIHDVLLDADYVPLVLGHTAQTTELQIIHTLLDRRVDGLLMRPDQDAMWEDHLHEVIDRDVPLVVFDNEVSQQGNKLDFVGTDDSLGGELVAEHLLALGHRRLAVVTTGKYPMPMHYRSKAFAKRVAQCPGATCDVKHVNSMYLAHEGAAWLLKQPQRPTAIFATMDFMAESIYPIAQQMGLAIGKDVSLVGYSDFQNNPQITPTLTTIRQNPLQIGRQAAHRMLSRIAEPAQPVQRILQAPQLIVRESSGPVR